MDNTKEKPAEKKKDEEKVIPTFGERLLSFYLLNFIMFAAFLLAVAIIGSDDSAYTTIIVLGSLAFLLTCLAPFLVIRVKQQNEDS